MEEQARAAERALLKERQAAPEGAVPKGGPVDLPPPPPPVDTGSGETTDEDVEFLVIEWVRSMADGDLGDADRSMMQLRKSKAAAQHAISRVSIANPPPAGLQDVPRPVLNRYFKMLKDTL